jgi:xanthine dehydrogenase accessory factor
LEDLILKKIHDRVAKGEKAALVLVTQSIGSTPRKAGSIMAVWEDGTIDGSIGGGRIEYEVIEQAMECIRGCKDSTFKHNLNSSGELGMQCGGQASGYIKVLTPRKKLLIAGGGHIGQQIHQLGKMLGFYNVIFDDREQYANSSTFQGVEEIHFGDIEEKVKSYSIDESCYVVIATRDQEGDLKALRGSIGRGAAYIGMIGSSQKAAAVKSRLLGEGINVRDLDKVYTPAGLDISSGNPEEIAMGIMSEILLVKNKGVLMHRRDVSKIRQDI